MKACLYAGYQNNGWIWETLPGKSPAEMPIGGKSWARHAIDMCSLLEVTDVFIADCFFHPELKESLGDGAFWSTHIHYLPSTDVGCPRQLFEQHEGRLPDDDLLIFWGQVLPDLPDIRQLFDDMRPVPPQPDDMLPDGIYLLRDGALRQCFCPLLRMDSVKSYFDLNMRLLNAPGIYNLPGFSSDSSFGIGRNVITLFGCQLKTPLIVQDNSCIGRSTVIDGDVIIGSNVLIDDRSYVKRAVILGNTYIGRRMHIEDKIISGRTVIDVRSGAHVDLEDHFLVGDTADRGADRFSVAESVIALFLLIWLLPGYLLALAFKWLRKLPFFKYVFHIYPALPRVVTGNADLVRNGARSSDYVFRFSDQWILPQDDRYQDFADVYFRTHRSIRAILAVVTASLLKRMFILTEPKR